MVSGPGGIWKFTQRLPVLGRARRGVEGGAGAATGSWISHNLGKLRRNEVPSEKKGRAEDPTDHGTSRARTPGSQSRSSPVTWGHRTMWRDAALRAQSRPQGGSCRAQGRDRTPGSRLRAQAPGRAREGTEVRAAPRTDSSRRLQSSPQGGQLAPPAVSGLFHPVLRPPVWKPRPAHSPSLAFRGLPAFSLRFRGRSRSKKDRNPGRATWKL